MPLLMLLNKNYTCFKALQQTCKTQGPQAQFWPMGLPQREQETSPHHPSPRKPGQVSPQARAQEVASVRPLMPGSRCSLTAPQPPINWCTLGFCTPHSAGGLKLCGRQAGPPGKGRGTGLGMQSGHPPTLPSCSAHRWVKALQLLGQPSKW